MAEQPSGPSEPLEVKQIRYLVRLMKRYDLTALDLNDGTMQIRLRRRSPEASAAPYAGQAATAAAGISRPAAPTNEKSEPAPAAGSPTPKTVVIESPMVGTFYASSAPDAPAFVTVGSIVQRDTIVCIIEAMKVFTDIPADVSGTIAEILVKNGQSVEFSQPLFRVIPS